MPVSEAPIASITCDACYGTGEVFEIDYQGYGLGRYVACPCDNGTVHLWEDDLGEIGADGRYELQEVA